MASRRREIFGHIKKINELAKEIESVQNLLPDLGSMRGVDEKCREIRQHCKAVAKILDQGSKNSGHGGAPDSGHGGAPNSGHGGSTNTGHG